MNPPTGEVTVSLGRGRGPWRPDQDVVELRRPQNTSVTSSEASGSNDAPNPNKDVLSTVAALSKLSVNAKEFVPRGFSTSETGDSTQASNFGSNSCSDTTEICERSQEELSDTSADEWFSQHLTEVMKSLTSDPGDFDSLVEPLLEELSPMLDNEDALNIILSIIIEQALAEPNFRYNGARLCCLLNKQVESSSPLVRRVLLNKLMEEHDNFENNLMKNRERASGFVYLLGEIYTQLEIKQGARITVLGDALLEALKILIQLPSQENIKNTCESLKLAGRMLDMGNKAETNTLFAELQKLLGDARVGDRSQLMISNILKLRSDNWGQVTNTETDSAVGNHFKNKSTVPAWINDGVNYGPDGQVLTAEEYKFLYESCEDNETVCVGDESTVWDPDVNDNENAEIMAAFREFVNQKR